MKNTLLKISFVLSLFSILVYAIPTFSSDVDTNIIKKNVQAEFDKQQECLAKNIYYEAAREPYEGKMAVAQVTINRTNDPQFPNTICGVVYQKTKSMGQTVCQFTWTCNHVSAEKNEYLWEEAKYIAKKALTQPIAHSIIKKTNAMFYHADYVHPKWKKENVVLKVGRHIFYAKV